MDRLQSIIVGVDFTPCSASALRQAIRIARWNQASLRVIHVLEPTVVRDLEAALGDKQPDVRGSMMRGAERSWKEFTANIPEAEGIEFVIDIDTPLSSMLRAVDAYRADLLVLGTHGTTSGDRGAGTTAAAVTRKAMTRVLLVHDPHGGPFRTVLACVDFSETSHRALHEAIRVAAQDKASLHILHVFDGPWNHVHYMTETAEASPDFQKQYRDALLQQLKEFAQPFEADMRDVRVQYHLYDYSSHGGGITDFVLENSIDLVVMGTRGTTNLRDLFMGSTAERVVRDTPCSILTVKPKP